MDKKEERLDPPKTGTRLIVQGLMLLCVGIGLIFTKTLLPEISIRFMIYLLLGSSILDVIMRLWKKRHSTDSLLVSLMKIAALSWLAGTDLATALPIYLFAILMGIYQILMGLVNFITYLLYRKNDIRPRIRLLMDSLWLGMMGGMTLLSNTGNASLQSMILGAYLALYGLTHIRDGIWFEKELRVSLFKRNIRISLPIVVAALLPYASLQKINRFIAVEEKPRELPTMEKDLLQTNDLEIFVHVSDKGFGALGHVDISYQGRVYGYGSYDVFSEKLFGAIGDGVLFVASKEAYVRFCTQEGMALFDYQVGLTRDQKKAIEEQISNLESLTIPWEPQSDLVAKDESGTPCPSYAYRMQEAISARLFKFTKSKFKTYFVMSTNCVLLADSIVGKTGSDVLSIKGFISPGTYQVYLEQEYERPNGLVTAKTIYSPSLVV